MPPPSPVAMRVVAGAALVLVMIPGMARPAWAEPGLLGLLEMPLIYRSLETDPPSPGTLAESPAVSIRAMPSHTARVIATLTSEGITRRDGPKCFWRRGPACPYREAGYEIPALIVFEVRPGNWYRIGVDTGTRFFGWVHSREPFHALTALIASGDRLTYLTGAWDGRLYASPRARDGRVVLPKAKRRGETPYRPLAHARVDGRLSIKVAVLDGVCKSAQEQTIATGWVPAKSPTGRPIAWFWSRGC